MSIIFLLNCAAFQHAIRDIARREGVLNIQLVVVIILVAAVSSGISQGRQ